MRGRRIVLLIVGFALTTFGITLVLQQWENLVLVFKAVIGPAVAVAGLVIMFASSIKQNEDGTHA